MCPPLITAVFYENYSWHVHSLCIHLTVDHQWDPEKADLNYKKHRIDSVKIGKQRCEGFQTWSGEEHVAGKADNREYRSAEQDRSYTKTAGETLNRWLNTLIWRTLSLRFPDSTSDTTL